MHSAGWLNVRDHGARGDGASNDTDALQTTVDACSAAGGGTVLVPAGTYLTGPLTLASRVTLHLEAGATLRASERLEDYAPDAERWSGESARAGLLTAVGAHDVAIVGRGTIDGRGPAFCDTDATKGASDLDPALTRQGEQFARLLRDAPDGPFEHGERPGNLVRFRDCTNVLVSGVTICNSPTWTVQFRDCEGVRVDGVRIHSAASGRRVPNDDGIDLRACRRVRITGCDIDTGDDCIAVFGSQELAVSDCTLRSRSSGIRVGYNTGETRDCVFSNLVIRDSNRGICVHVRGPGSVENVLFSNLVIRTRLHAGQWWGNGEPIHVSTLRLREDGRPLGHVRGVRFAHVVAEGEHGILLHGGDEGEIRDVAFEDVSLRVRAGELQAARGGNFDLRGAPSPGCALFRHDVPGLYALRVRELALRSFRLEWDAGLPDFYTHGLWLEDCPDARVEGFTGGPNPAAPGATAVLRSPSGPSRA